MKRFTLRTLLLTLCASVAVSQIMAQDVDVEELKNSVSTYTSKMLSSAQGDTQSSETEVRPIRLSESYPSVKYKSSLQVGAAIPGLTLFVLFNRFSALESKSQPEYTFGSRLENARYYNTSTISVPVLSLEYNGSVTRWLALGLKATVGFQTMTKRHVATNALYRRYNHVAASALFNMRFTWLRRNIVTMYSSVGLGLTSHFRNNIYDYSHFMMDATWVGIQLGKQLYGFAEFGAGIGGVLRGGIGVRF